MCIVPKWFSPFLERIKSSPKWSICKNRGQNSSMLGILIWKHSQKRLFPEIFKNVEKLTIQKLNHVWLWLIIPLCDHWSEIDLTRAWNFSRSIGSTKLSKKETYIVIRRHDFPWAILISWPFGDAISDHPLMPSEHQHRKLKGKYIYYTLSSIKYTTKLLRIVPTRVYLPK